MGSASGKAGGTPGVTHQLLGRNDLGSLAKYRRMVVGEETGWGSFLLYELLTGLLGPMPGALGYLLRNLGYRALFKESGKGASIGRNVTVRHPGRISLGRGAAVDENVLLDARRGFISLGSGTILGRNSMVSSRGTGIRIGDGCSIGTGVRLATLGFIEIGDHVLVAANCYVGGGNHRHERLDVPIISQGMEEPRGVRIGRGAWIGAGSIVMGGVTVGEDAIVGAASLVREDIPPRAVAVGQPARVVRYRDGN